MKNQFRIFILLMLSLATVLTSCDKDSSDDTVPPSGPSDYTTTTVLGVVFDQNHNALSGVEITLGTKTFTTNYDGAFIFKNVLVNKDRFLAKFKKTGYFETVKTEKTVSGGVTRLSVALIDKAFASSSSFSSVNGGDLDMSADGLIHFPAGLSYIDADGNEYNGNITVNAKFLDASTEDYSRFAPGGDQFGVLSSSAKSIQSDDVYLMSIGGMIIELTGGSGELLNLASDNDSLVTIETPIPSAFLTIAPDTIDNWYMGGDLAYSSNEGSGRKEGGKYISQVGHFSFWSMEIPYTGSATIKGKVTDSDGNPVAGVRVNIGQSYAVTDNNGYYSRLVPAGIAGIPVQVLATDFNNYSSNQEIQPLLTDGQVVTVDLTISIPAGDMIAVYGTLVNCNSTPIAGSVLVSYGSYVAQTYTLDGSFSLLVPSSAYSISVECEVDGVTKEVWVYPGTDPNVGDVVFCAPPAGSNEINVDGEIYNSYTESTAALYTQSNSLNITYSDGGDYQTYLDIDAYTGPGTYNLIEYYKDATASIYTMYGSYTLASGTLTVTSDGGVGGRVIGTFTGTAVSGESISGKFNAYREADEAK